MAAPIKVMVILEILKKMCLPRIMWILTPLHQVFMGSETHVSTFNTFRLFCSMCTKEIFERLSSVWNFKGSIDTYKAWICIWRRSSQLYQKSEQFAKLETDWKIKHGFMDNAWAHLSLYKGIIFPYLICQLLFIYKSMDHFHCRLYFFQKSLSGVPLHWNILVCLI
jgi:hypothetical protein